MNADEQNKSDDDSRIDEESSSSRTSARLEADSIKRVSKQCLKETQNQPATVAANPSDDSDRRTTATEPEDMKRACAKKLIERYFYQLVDGCGNPKCNNKFCASSGKVDKLTPNAAAARAIQLFSQEAKLCDMHPSKVAKTASSGDDGGCNVAGSSSSGSSSALDDSSGTDNGGPLAKGTDSMMEGINDSSALDGDSMDEDDIKESTCKTSSCKNLKHPYEGSNNEAAESGSGLLAFEKTRLVGSSSVSSNNPSGTESKWLPQCSLNCNRADIVGPVEFLDEEKLQQLLASCVDEPSEALLISRLDATFSSYLSIAASFQRKVSSSIDAMLEKTPGDLKNLKKEDLRTLEGDLDKDEDSLAEKTPEVQDPAYTTVDLVSLRRAMQALYQAKPSVFGPIDHAFLMLGETLTILLRVKYTPKEVYEQIVTVFVIVFEVLRLGTTEFLEVSFPRICAAVCYLPIWAQARLVHIWAKHCRDSIHPLLQQLQQLITISSLSLNYSREVKIHDTELVCNAVRVMKIVFYANILAGEIESKQFRETDLRDSALPAYLSLIPEDEDLHLYSASKDKKSKQTKLEDPLAIELDINILDCRKPLVPYEEFYNESLCDFIEMDHDYLVYKSITADGLLPNDPKKNFCFMLHSFILTPATKVLGLYYDSRIRMYSERRLSYLHQQLGGGSNLQSGNPYLNLKIRRDHIIDDALVELEMIAMSNPKDLKKQLVVEFSGEQGIDEGGVSKEFFQLIIEEIFNPDFGMFVNNEDTNTVWFNSTSFENEAQFTLIGIVVGLALYNNIILAVNFPMVVYRKLMGMKGSFVDLMDWNPVLFNSLKSLLDHHENDMEEVFMQTFKICYKDVFGNPIHHELKPDGDRIFVCQDNKQEFVELYSDFMLNQSIEKQFRAFRRGFQMVTDESPLHLLFRPEEIELIVCGSEEFDFNELEHSTEYEGGFSSESQSVKDFWSIVHGLTMEGKRKLLQFTTGSDRVPVGGLSRLKLVIVRNGPDCDRLPTSHTCFNVLLLPEYSTREKLEERLLKAINYSKGFGML